MPSDHMRKFQKLPSDDTIKEARFLDKVTDLLKIPVKKYKNHAESISNQKYDARNSATFDKESKLLKQFWAKFKSQRLFSQSQHVDKFILIFRELINSRLSNRYWKEHAHPENFLRIFQCLRLLLRDGNFQSELHTCDGLPLIAHNLRTITEKHSSHGSDDMLVDILKEILNICLKISGDTHQRRLIIANNIHESLVLLLSSSCLTILHSSLYVLIAVTKSEETKPFVSELNCTERLVQMVESYDVTSKQLAVTLLRQLCTLPDVKNQIKIFHGIPVLLSLLRNDVLKLVWNVVWMLVHLAEDHDTSDEIRLLGGIPLLVALLQNRSYNIEHDVNGHMDDHQPQITNELNLKSAVCAALTELVLNDTNARHLVQANGIYFVAIQIFVEKTTHEIKDRKSAETQLQKNAFRTLRFLFSMERNRQLFKRIFPPDLFELFIDVGHYQKDLDSYNSLVQSFNMLPGEDILEIKEKVLAINQNKEPSSYIQQYAVYEHLGSGAFGSVYKDVCEEVVIMVKKKGGQTFLAMKEENQSILFDFLAKRNIYYNVISIHHPEFGKSMKDKTTSTEGIMNECSFVKKQMHHTNIVTYHKAFLQGEKLYIIMDLIDGAPLGEHFNSLKEKQQMFNEVRLWNIFIQMVLALHYIHKEKFVVHRDLTPNNIMLGEGDKVTITDFGLARQKNPDASKLMSMVGTIVYSCPEVVRGVPYCEKADIWALGCILYQMATLEPPFFSSNMLSLATKIAEGDYEPILEGLYSSRVAQVIKGCLTVKAEERPDVLQVASIIPDLLISHIEELKIQSANLKKSLEKERKRLQRHTDNWKNYRVVHGQHHQQQHYDEVFSEDSKNNTQESLLSGRELNQVDAYPLSGSDRYSGLASTKYEKNLVDSSSDFIAGVVPLYTKDASNPIRISGKPRNESQVSSSGSYDSNNEEEIFNSKKPRRLFDSRGYTNDRKNSRPDVIELKNPIHVKRTNSCSYPDSLNALEKTPTKIRPTSAQTTLTISPRRVRVIDDPVLQMLTQIHKIIYLTQLPPTLKFDANKRVIEQYKRALFSSPSSALTLKNEMKKLMEGSKEHVDLQLNQVDMSSKFSSSLSSMSEYSAASTYEELKSILENSLVETGYYNVPPAVRMKPLGPIIQTNKVL